MVTSLRSRSRFLNTCCMLSLPPSVRVDGGVPRSLQGPGPMESLRHKYPSSAPRPGFWGAPGGLGLDDSPLEKLPKGAPREGRLF